MKIKYIPLLLCLVLLAGCGVEKDEGESKMKQSSYTKISADEAKTMMDEQEDYILLDVRAQSEFDTGHIEGAILIPDGEIKDRAEAELADKDAAILVYCRSGRRSKIAAQALVEMGYTNVLDFGGIADWPYETVK